VSFPYFPTKEEEEEEEEEEREGENGGAISLLRGAEGQALGFAFIKTIEKFIVSCSGYLHFANMLLGDKSIALFTSGLEDRGNGATMWMHFFESVEAATDSSSVVKR